MMNVFKKYQKKNQRKLTPIELKQRSDTVTLLRNNLNLLKKEFESQMERNQTKPMKKGGKRKDREFVDIFGINNS